VAARKHAGARAGAGGRAAAGPPRARARFGFGGGSREQVAEIQRSRLLAGAVAAVDEVGYEATTVAQITARSRVSRRTFYELFKNREECLATVLDSTVEAVERELGAAGVAGFAWREQLRVGLWTILAFLDGDPVLARVCLVQAQRGGGVVQQRREAVLARLARVVDEGRKDSRLAGVSSLTAEGLVSACAAIVSARLARGGRQPLEGLHGELLGMVLLPYLGGAAARREQARPAPVVQPARSVGRRVRALRAHDPLEGLPMRMTYRTARVLEVVGGRPGASNREIASQAGIADQGQMSKLLARLQGLGLLTNSGEGHIKGEPNAWSLTAQGERVVRGMSLGSRHGSQAA
jgi:AcrR family transcriptional regulator